MCLFAHLNEALFVFLIIFFITFRIKEIVAFGTKYCFIKAILIIHVKKKSPFFNPINYLELTLK